jgi:GR25 family glycosyltransferase involved in LPS biosynthesis
MKFTHKVFHLDDAIERKEYAKNINSYLNQYSVELNTETIKISNQEEFVKVISENKDFNLDFNGYNLDNLQGWKYGEVGIFASNFKAWKEFINSDADYAILIEDDIVFKDNFMELLKKYILEIEKDWDVLFFAVPEDQFYKYKTTGVDINLKNVCQTYQDYSMLCYIINKSGALKAINTVQDGIRLPLDWYFMRQQNIFDCYSVKPTSEFACYQASVETTIQNKTRKVMTID